MRNIFLTLLLLFSQITFAASGSGDLGNGDPGVASYTTFAGFPAIAVPGVLAVDKATNSLYVFDGATNTWVAVGGGGGGGVTSVSGTAPVVSSGGATPAISMAAATNAVNGYLTAVDHTTFAAKVSPSRLINTTAPLTGGGDLSADRTLAMPVSTNAVDGYLSAADHTTFAAKEPAITATTSADYYRGDKTFQNFNAAAIGSVLTAYSAGAGVVAATDSVLQAIQKLDGNISAIPAAWKLSGNAGTGGTGVVGTTDAQPWTTTVNGIFVEGYQTDGQVSSILNVTPVDGTNFRQRNWQTNLNAGASTTTANFRNVETSVGYGGSGFDYAGSISNIVNNVSHNGTEHIGFMGSAYHGGFFSGGGHTDIVKNNDSNVGVTGPYQIDNFVGASSYLNATQLTGDGSAFQAGVTLADSTITNFYLYNGNLDVSGTSNFSGNASLWASNLHLLNTANVGQAFGTNFGVQFSDNSTANGVYGNNFFTVLQNSAAVSGQTYGQSNGVTLENAATSNGVTGSNINMQFKNTSSAGNINGDNPGIFMQDTATASSVNGINNTIQLQGGNVVPNVTGESNSVSIQSTSAVQNLNGNNTNVTLQNSATSDNVGGFTYNVTIDNSAVVANGINGGNINMQTNGGTTVPAAQGLGINMSNVNLSPAVLAAGGQKVGLNINDGSLNVGYGYTVPGAAGFFQNHYIGGSAIVAAADPTASFGFGTNLAQSVVLHDNWSIDASGLGYVDVGFVGSMAFDAGKTMARWTGALGGAGDPSSGAGSVLTDAIMFRAAGILPQGGSLAVTNMYGFQVDPNLFCIIGTNCWGIYEDTAAAQNHLSKLAIGTASKKVANSDTAFEIGNNKALLNGRGTTVQRNALAALAGMQFYDTDLNALYWYDGSAWVAASGAGAVTSVGATAPVASSGGTTPTISISQSGVATDGYLSSTDWNTFNGKRNKKLAVVDGGDAAYSILAADDHIRSTTALTADRTYTLPACAGGNVGERHSVKNLPSQTFNIILAGNGGDLVDGNASVTLHPGDSKPVVCAVAGTWDIE